MSNFKFTEAEENVIYSLSIDLDSREISFHKFIKGIEQIINERPDGWISVKNQLPDFGQKVLVAYEPSSPIMERWDYTVTKRNDLPLGTVYARMMDENKFRIDGKVTHWQPFPKIPSN